MASSPVQLQQDVMTWTPSCSTVGIYIGLVIEPKAFKMIILFGLVIHLLGIFPKEVKYQQDYIPKDLCLKVIVLSLDISQQLHNA